MNEDKVTIEPKDEEIFMPSVQNKTQVKRQNII